MPIVLKRLALPMLLLLISAAPPADDAVMNARIDALMARMTLEEKAGQLTVLDDSPAMERQVRAGLVGGTGGVLPDQDVAAFTHRLQALAMQSRLKIPMWFMGDVAHGFRTIFPTPLAMAATWDTDLVTQVHRAAAVEATAAGVDWTFSPMLDIARDPRWGRMVEGAGEDPYLGSAMAVAQMRGFQGEDLAAPDTMMATAKHFAGYGAVQAGRDYNSTDIPDRLFRDLYLPPFKAVVDAGIGSVMAAFTAIDGVPATSSRELLTDTLRTKWGFKGLIVSDYDAVSELQAHGIAATPADAARLALHAGVDVDLHSGTYLAELPALVRGGKVPQAELDAAVRRVLEAKYQLGLFNDPYHYGDAARVARVTLTPAHKALARQAAREAMVLLKNDGVLPLARRGRIAVIGPLAEATQELLGPMPALGKREDVVPVLAGIRGAAAGKATVSFAQGTDVRGMDTRGIPAAVAAARASDLVVLVLGESIDMIGEGNSRASIDLPGRQRELAEAVVATGRPVVAVVVSGRAMDLSWLDAHVGAIVYTGLSGDEAGTALGDLLFGEVDFSGRLPITFPRALGQVPIAYDQPPTGRPGRIDQVYTSRYVDQVNAPLYPFGYGLSYTRFSYGAPRLDSSTLAPGGTLHVTTRVTNAGSRSGTAVAQLYVHDLIADVSRPVRELKGFKRIALTPDEARDVTFALTPTDLAFMRRDKSFGTEPGEYELFVGGDSGATQVARFTLSGS